jgi:EAL domain-containing protein (putative c-di-GMP-specific phosphodiesterase class I)
MIVTSEGIETIEERDELVRAGCDLMQGFLFARPEASIRSPMFDPLKSEIRAIASRGPKASTKLAAHAVSNRTLAKR